jgi:glycosyltransferase involved in cell wall biosynthesis
VDSAAIKEDMKLSNKRVSVISYAPHFDEAKKPEYKNANLEPNRYFVAIARFVDENQILQLIDGYISSGRDEQLFIIGLGTGRRKYEMRVINAAQRDENIQVLPRNYDRAEINWLLQNAKGYIHGHSVGGTNPILVDARLHAQLILSHDNPYNRENSGNKEHFWSDNDQLSKLLKNIDLLEVNTDSSDYGLDSWETIALQYLDLLTKKD